MSKLSSRQTMARQWELLKATPSRGSGATASELTDHLNALNFSVSKRTVERDLQELSSYFGIDCNEKSKPYGWKWMKGGATSIPSVSLAEALSLQLVENLIRPQLPAAILRALEPKFAQAQQTLHEMTKENPVASWPGKILVREPTLPLVPPKIDQDVLEQVQDAVLRESQVRVEYVSAGSTEVKKLTLHPCGMVQRGSISYLVATADQFHDLRLYAIHRIRSAVQLKGKAQSPKGFSLEEYIDQGAMEFGTGKKIRLRAKIERELAQYLMETPIAIDAQIRGDGEWLSLIASVTDTWQLRWWILSQGQSIEILSPAGLRRDIAAELKQAAELYS